MSFFFVLFLFLSGRGMRVVRRCTHLHRANPSNVRLRIRLEVLSAVELLQDAKGIQITKAEGLCKSECNANRIVSVLKEVESPDSVPVSKYHSPSWSMCPLRLTMLVDHLLDTHHPRR